MTCGLSVEGFAIISADGMIATGDGTHPATLMDPADQAFFHGSLDRAAVVVHGRYSHEGGPRAAARKRLIVTRRVPALAPHPRHPNGMLWNPVGMPFAQACAALGVSEGVAAIIGGTDVFGLFLSIGYDAFFLSRALASVPRGRPVFPGVGNGVAAEEPLKQHGLVLRETRMLDPVSETVVQEWGPK